MKLDHRGLKHRSGIHLLRPDDNLGCWGLVLGRRLYMDLYERPGHWLRGIFVAWNLNQAGTEYSQFAFRMWFFWSGYRAEVYNNGTYRDFYSPHIHSSWYNHYRSLVCDCQYERVRFPRIAAAWELFLRAAWCPLVCRIRGHQYESYADGENGSEDVWCQRCGTGHHAQF